MSTVEIDWLELLEANEDDVKDTLRRAYRDSIGAHEAIYYKVYLRADGTLFYADMYADTVAVFDDEEQEFFYIASFSSDTGLGAGPEGEDLSDEVYYSLTVDRLVEDVFWEVSQELLDEKWGTEKTGR